MAYWQGKCETLKLKISTAHEEFKRSRHKQEVLSCLILYSSVFTCLLTCFVLSSFVLCFDVIKCNLIFHYSTGRKLTIAYCSYYNIEGILCEERGQPLNLTSSAKPSQKYLSLPPSPFAFPPIVVFRCYDLMLMLAFKSRKKVYDCTLRLLQH